MSDIVISAQDQASKILDKVGNSGKVLAKDLDASSKAINIAFSSFAGPLAAVGAAVAAFKGVGALGSFLASSVEGLDAATEATRKLSTAINLSGGDASKSIEGHLALADAIEKQLNVDADVVQGLMAQASALGVADKNLDAVTKTAIGLSETMGIGLDEALSKARLATEGNFKAFEKLNPAITELNTGEEKLAAVLALAEKGLIQKAEAAGSAAQADERAGFALGKLQDNIGAVLSPLRELAYDGFTVVVESIQGAFGPSIETAGEYFESFRDIVIEGAMAFSNGLIAAVTIVEVGWNNLGTVFGVVQNTVLLSLETLRADIEHVLTQVIPAYATWFADNFVNILIDAGTAYVTAWTNIAYNVAEIVKTLYDVVVGNIDFNTAFKQIGETASRGLLDGFEATTQALPDIAARAMTDTEKALSKNLDTSTTSLLEQFQTKFDERIGVMTKNLETEPISAQIKIDTDTDALNRKIKADKESVLTFSETRLLTKGDNTEDPQKKIVENTALANKQLEKLNSRFDKVQPTTVKVIGATG